MRWNYIKEYKKGFYTAMQMKGLLQDYLVEIDKKGMEMEHQIVQEIAKKENINEELKAKDQLKWVELMNAIRNQAEEILIHEIVYED